MTTTVSPTTQLLEGGLPLIAAAVVDLAHECGYRDVRAWIDRLKASVEAVKAPEPFPCPRFVYTSEGSDKRSVSVPGRRYTAPEPLPVGAKVRIVELGRDSDPSHGVGDIVSVVYWAPNGDEIRFSASVKDQDSRPAYFVESRDREGTWVRTVELVEPAQVAGEGEPRCEQHEGNPYLLCGRCYPARVAGEGEGLTDLVGDRLRRERDEARDELALVSDAANELRARVAHVDAEATRLAVDRDALAARVRELEVELADANKRANLASSGLWHIQDFCQSNGVGVPGNAIAPAFYAVSQLRDQRDAANARADRMEALCDAAGRYCHTLEQDAYVNLVKASMAYQRAREEAALDAATASEQAEPSAPPT